MEISTNPFPQLSAKITKISLEKKNIEKNLSIVFVMKVK
jgi:hypothetical protein